MRYRIATNTSMEALQKQVQKLIEEGWVPQGGVCINTAASRITHFYQALILEVE